MPVHFNQLDFFVIDGSLFGPNLSEFVKRFDAATTNGQGTSFKKKNFEL